MPALYAQLGTPRTARTYRVLAYNTESTQPSVIRLLAALGRWVREIHETLWLWLAWFCHAATVSQGQEWPVYGGNPAGTKYSPLTHIHRTNVHQLKPVWVYRCDDMRERPATTIECNPLAIDGTLYLTTPGLKLVALEAASGKERWRFDPFQGAGGRGVNRGITYWQSGDDRRLFLPAGSYVYAIEARSGKRIESFGTQGRIDLREGMDQDLFNLSVSTSSPGVVYQDLIIFGSSVGEGPAPAAPGHIRAYDVRTGKRRWIFHTIPHPGEPGYETWPPDAWKTLGGCNAWGGLTLDADRGIVFCGTGSASYDHFGGNRVGANLYANCVLALDAATGQRKWHFQTLHHDLWDYDLPCPPTLISTLHAGRQIDAVAQPTKTGFLFVLDRLSGQPLHPVVERRVARSEIPGEQSWPTQPIPSKPPPFAQQGFTESDITDLSPTATAAIRERLKTIRPAPLYEPPGLQATVVLPQFNGGAEWGGAAFDPNTGLVILNASNEAEWISMVPSKPKDTITLGELGSQLYRGICSTCHGGAGTAVAGIPQSPSLVGLKQRLKPEDFLMLLDTGRGQMPSFSALSPVEKRALQSFLFEMSREQTVRASEIGSLWADEIPFVSSGHNELRDPEGFPANKRPWGTLTALDPGRGELVWQVPLGTYPTLEKRGLPPTGTFNIGGPIVTAGGLVFIGATMDERVRAFDSRTGKTLWEFQLDAGAYATPATFEVGGRQYLVFAAGGGGKPETRPGNAYWCFALPITSTPNPK